MKRALLFFIGAAIAAGQPTIAPGSERLGTARGEDVDGYNIVNSFETGYRLRSVGGNLDKYRSDVNFGNGVRLLGSTFSVHSKEGHGRFFDEFLVNTQGLGNDPYEYSSVRLQKNRLYRYDFLWRDTEYYNPALPISFGQHRMDTTRTLQDHNLVLLPQSFFKVFLGYSRNNQNGPALSTANLFGHTDDDYPVFRDVRRLQNEYRFGAELDIAGVRLSFQRGWESLRDDTEQSVSTTIPGNDPQDLAMLNQFYRVEPYHGTTRNWRVNLLADRSKFVTFNGRFTYAGSRRNFIFDETATATDAFGSARNRQILVFGDARRPVTSAALTTTLFPSKTITVVNHTAFHQTRMDGDGSYQELVNATGDLTQVDFSFLGLRTISSSTDLNFSLAPSAGFFVGYQYADRRIRSVEQVTFGTVPDRVEAEQSNHVHAGRTGIRLRPVKPLSIVLDAELGRASRPVYPTSDRNYHALGGRIQYRTRNLTLSALVRTNYNTNSVSLFSHSSRSRTYAADASWTVTEWLGFDANYSKLHLDTLTGIAYFFAGDLIENDRSAYFSNIHTGSFGARISLRNRADLMLGYTHVQDVGDSRDRPLTGTPSIGYQTFPMTFASPYARLSIRLTNKVRWNVAYQHYGYNEELYPVRNYRAHTGLTSLSWSF
jgi:hypothetical protein